MGRSHEKRYRMNIKPILAGTGHRPEKIFIGTRNAYDPQVFNELVRFAEIVLIEYDPRGVISGMALGWDQALAKASINLEIPFVAATPFVGQEKKWPKASQDYYNYLMENAA